MELPNYYQNIIVSAVLGLISAVLFDFFRSFRKASTSKSDFIVVIQDIIYLLIITCCIIISIYYFIDDDIRIYMIVSFLLSIYVYEKLISKYIISLFIAILNKIKSINSFIFITIKIHLELNKKIIIFLHKFVKICCIKIIYMVTYICKKLDFIHKQKPKKKVEYEKKRKKRRKN